MTGECCSRGGWACSRRLHSSRHNGSTTFPNCCMSARCKSERKKAKSQEKRAAAGLGEEEGGGAHQVVPPPDKASEVWRSEADAGSPPPGKGKGGRGGKRRSE